MLYIFERIITKETIHYKRYGGAKHMAKMLDKVLNFVGWETEDDLEEESIDSSESSFNRDYLSRESFTQDFTSRETTKKPFNRVVNIHTNQQFKMVVVHPESFEDTQDICDHLKNKKPVVVNVESVEGEQARRIIDFLSGSIYALDGNIQKVSSNIFIVAPNNVNIMADFKDELRGKTVFPWTK